MPLAPAADVAFDESARTFSTSPATSSSHATARTSSSSSSSRRYERGTPIIITSSKSLVLRARGEVLGQNMFAAGILDRVLHHSINADHQG